MRNEYASQKEMFTRYSSQMFGVCLRYARNKADAEDILQESFIKVFAKLHQFKFEGSFEGWIRKIIVNTALKKYTLMRYEKEIDNLEYVETFEKGESPIVYNEISQKDLLTLINQLPDGYRMVFNLYAIEGYQHDEIAQILGIQASTSRSQLVKARVLLQKQVIEMQKIMV